jgi:hypothetical protein
MPPATPPTQKTVSKIDRNFLNSAVDSIFIIPLWSFRPEKWNSFDCDCKGAVFAERGGGQLGAGGKEPWVTHVLTNLFVHVEMPFSGSVSRPRTSWWAVDVFWGARCHKKWPFRFMSEPCFFFYFSKLWISFYVNVHGWAYIILS